MFSQSQSHIPSDESPKHQGTLQGTQRGREPDGTLQNTPQTLQASDMSDPDMEAPTNRIVLKSKRKGKTKEAAAPPLFVASDDSDETLPSATQRKKGTQKASGSGTGRRKAKALEVVNDDSDDGMTFGGFKSSKKKGRK